MTTLKINAADLAADVAWIAKGMAKRTHVPVLATAHVSIVDDGLQVRATDFDLWRSVTVPAESAGGDDVAILVDPVKLSALLKGSKGDALIDVTDEGLEIVIGARTVTVTAATAEIADYPEWPVFESVARAEFDTAVMKRALVSVGKDDTLPMLTGVRFDDDGVMATTDRFRLTRVDFTGESFTGLVPGGALRLFSVGKGMMSVESGVIGVETSEHGNAWVRITRGGRSVVSRQLDAEFPKYRQLIPSEPTIVAEINRADLLGALAGISVDLEFHVDASTMTVHGLDRDHVAMVSQTVAADVATDDGLPFRIRLATEYLTAALKGIDGDTVTFSGTTSTRPMVFEAGDTIHLIMPQRVPA